MSVAAADAVPAGRPAFMARATLYGAAQALVVAFCALLFVVGLPQPDAAYLLDQATFRMERPEATPPVPVTLPHRWGQWRRDSATGIYRLTFVRPPDAGGEPWSVYLPRFTNRAGVRVNGHLVPLSGVAVAAGRPDRSLPALLPIQAPVLREGENELEIALEAWGPLSGFLSRVYVGPDARLRPSHEIRLQLFWTLPIMLAAWQVMLAVMLGIVFMLRRAEPAYGILTAAIVVGLAHSLAGAIVPSDPSSRLAGVLLSLLSIEGALHLVFVFRFLRERLPVPVWLLFLPGAGVTLLALFGEPGPARAWLFILCVPGFVGLCLAASAVAAARAAVGRADPAAWFFGIALTALTVFWIHDVLTVAGLTGGEPVFYARLASSLLMVAIGAALSLRLVLALAEIDTFANRMARRVAEAEAALRESFIREETQAKATALTEERSRLVRDLHDGVGGHLVSIVALSETAEASRAAIGEAARRALGDMRLVIDAIDDIGGELMLVIASWRERAEARLRAHGIRLDLVMDGPDPLPVHREIRPTQVLQVMRILDEAVTNAVRHSGARAVTVRVGTEAGPDGRHGRIVVSDDGRGFPPGAGEGRGLGNMRHRAGRIGARLTVRSGPGGTTLTLDLPERFPEP